MSIYNGLREEIIDGTPVGYSNLYTGNKLLHCNQLPIKKMLI